MGMPTKKRNEAGLRSTGMRIPVAVVIIVVYFAVGCSSQAAQTEQPRLSTPAAVQPSVETPPPPATTQRSVPRWVWWTIAGGVVLVVVLGLAALGIYGAVQSAGRCTTPTCGSGGGGDGGGGPIPLPTPGQ